MRISFGLFVGTFAVFWLLFVCYVLLRESKGHPKIRWILAFFGLLIMLGAGGFFAAALSASAVLKFPNSFEWPAGYVRGVATTADGKYIVPLVPSGRVQIYDRQWRFIRGWHVDAEGGVFRVACSENGLVDVYTARGQHHYTFTENGDLVSTRTLSEPFDSKGSSDEWVVVPTSPLLWVFSSPFLSWAVAVVGMAGFAMVKKLADRLGLAG
jgi:hypothetical protein